MFHQMCRRSLLGQAVTFPEIVGMFENIIVDFFYNFIDIVFLIGLIHIDTYYKNEIIYS